MRIDSTQEVYKKFVERQIISPEGFNISGLTFLTNNYKLFKQVLEIEKHKLKDMKVKTKVEILKTLMLPLSKMEDISSLYTNAIFFSSPEYSGMLDDRSYGGTDTLILSDEPEKLIDFVEPIYNNHLTEHNINLNCSSFYINPDEPSIYVGGLSINNNKCDTEELYFGTRLGLKVFNSKVKSAINDGIKTFNTP